MPNGNAPLTDDDRDQVRTLHAAGLARNDIAREIGRSPSTVSKLAKELGLSFDRSKTAVATAAKVLDAKAKRAVEMNELLDDARRLRLQLFAPCTLRNFGGKDNTLNQIDVDVPPFADQAKIMQAYSTAVATSLRLDVHDADSGAGESTSMLDALAAGLGAAYEQLKNRTTDDAGG